MIIIFNLKACAAATDAEIPRMERNHSGTYREKSDDDRAKFPGGPGCAGPGGRAGLCAGRTEPGRVGPG